jgi:hypothetical protein
MMEVQPSIYLDNLRSLPFVHRACLRSDRPGRRTAADGVLELTTPRGHRKLRVEEKTSHLTLAVARDLIARVASRATPPLILFAPYVSAEMAAVLLSHGINFVDTVGNCHLDLGGHYVAHIEGRKLDDPWTHEARTPAGVCLLVEPEPLNRSTCRIAAAAVSVSALHRTFSIG